MSTEEKYHAATKKSATIIMMRVMSILIPLPFLAIWSPCRGDLPSLKHSMMGTDFSITIYALSDFDESRIHHTHFGRIIHVFDQEFERASGPNVPLRCRLYEICAYKRLTWVSIFDTIVREVSSKEKWHIHCARKSGFEIKRKKSLPKNGSKLNWYYVWYKRIFQWWY